MSKQETMDVDQFRRDVLKQSVPYKRHGDGPLVVECELPPKVLHPNGRTKSHRYRAAMVKRTRQRACSAASSFLYPPRYKSVTIHPTFYLKRKQDGDNLNAWIKPIIDGLQDAGIVANDSGVTLLAPRQVTGAKEIPRVVLTITPNPSE